MNTAFFRRLGGAVALGATLSLAGAPVSAEEFKLAPRAVLELFTSQGCSSCPPADALLSELSERDDIVALAYHVDYWDYIGWRDTFGSAENSNFQRAYAAGWGSSRIYTPQTVINGADDVVGSRAAELHRAIGQAQLNVPVTLQAEGDMLTIDIDGQAGLDEAVVWLVAFIDRADVSIERGENSGKQISYTHVVTERRALGMWEPGAGTHLKVPLSEVMGAPADGLAIIIQEDLDGLPGTIFGAALYQAN